MAPRRKFSAHAITLWSLISLAAVVLLGSAVYVVLLVKAASSLQASGPVRHLVTAAELPSAFGTVTGLAGGSELLIQTKQPYRTIVSDELTRFAALGGGDVTYDDIRVGAVIAATGKDIGGGQLLAEAVTVIKNGEEAPAVVAEPVSKEPTMRQLTKTFTLSRKDGTRSSVITPTSESTWWVTADGQELLNIETQSDGTKSTTTYGLSTRVIKE